MCSKHTDKIVLVYVYNTGVYIHMYVLVLVAMTTAGSLSSMPEIDHCSSNQTYRYGIL